MLTVHDRHWHRPIHRRELLRIGALGLAGLSLPTLLKTRAMAANKVNPLTGRSVIFLFQQGGPSQFETFDPKPDAPDGIRTVGDTLRTSLPGVHFSAYMQRLARLAHKFVTVRSFQTNNSGHNIQPIVGPDSLQTAVGVHYARVAGVTRARTGMPTNAVLFPGAVDPTMPKGAARGDLGATGTYGKGYAPFVPGKGGSLEDDMTLNLPRERFFDDRRALLAALDRLNRRVDSGGAVRAMDDIQQQAYRVLMGDGVAQALDLSRESPKTVERYDTSGYMQGDRWNTVSRGRKGFYNAQAGTLGKLLLQARRLCEAGCGFVTVHASYAGVWDMHADGNNLSMADGMEAVGRSFDHAVAAFIEDVEARGLQDKILLVCCGEMGRTPRINKRGGRDHWGRLAPLILYGGGVGEGKVIGQSDKHGGEPATENFTPRHLIATILGSILDPGEVRLMPEVPTEIKQLMDHPPIRGV